MDDTKNYKKYKEEDFEGDFSFVSEECFYCHIELIETEDILVDKLDRYICPECNDTYGLNAVPCRDLNY